MLRNVQLSFATMSILTRLEAQAIHWIREVYSQYPKTVMLWSAGKDSTALLWMVKKAFFGEIPFPIVHIDTSVKPPELLLFRDQLAKEWGFKLIVLRNEAAISQKQTFFDRGLTRMQCCKNLKSQPLIDLVKSDIFPSGPVQVVIVGLRSDEEGSRSKERFVSLRDKNSQWDPVLQPPEMDGVCPPAIPDGYHFRLHPLLEWTETLIWEYTRQEGLPVNPLYFSKDGMRYRSLGCLPCSAPFPSRATNVDEILLEMRHLAETSERKGRGQDSEDGGLETLRRGGYM